jgi:hypothetical protein
MKFTTILLPLSILLISLSGCHKGKIGFVNGKGDLVTESRNVSGFNQIHVSNDVTVFFVQDSIYSVVVSAQTNILKVLDTKVENQVLVIDFNRNVFKHKNIQITVHAPSLTGLDISGSGEINVQNTLHTSDLHATISGSGKISVGGVEAGEVKINISGSGNVAIGSGNSINTTCNVSGSGNILAPLLISQSAKATISGSGNIHLQVVQYLAAHISGSGDIFYRGLPAVDVNISGSGHLNHVD